MDDEFDEFLDDYDYESREIETYEKSEEWVNGMFAIIFFLTPFLAGIIWWLGYFETHWEISIGVLGLTIVVSLSILLIARRSRNATGLTKEDISIYYFVQSVRASENENYDQTLSHLENFENYATKNTNSIFADTAKNEITNYVNDIDQSIDLKETFDEFSHRVFEMINRESLEDLIQQSDESETVTNWQVFSTGLNTLPGDRYLAAQVLAIGISLIIFFYFNENLGMLLAIALLTIIPRLNNTTD